MIDFNLSPEGLSEYLSRCKQESKEKYISEATAWTAHWGAVKEQCALDFGWFCEHYVKVSKPSVPGISTGGVVPMQMWPHIRDAIKHLTADRYIVVLKARQIGWSTLLAAYIAWAILFHDETKVSLTSKGMPEAQEDIAKARTVIDYLPWPLVTYMDPKSLEAIGFPDSRTAVRAFPSTTGAGKGYTPSVLIYDEHAEHEYAALNYNAAKPGIDTIGGQLISVFTAPDIIEGNYAVSIFLDALAGKNGFVPLFYPWNVVPGRDQAWYEKVKRSITKDRIGNLTPELYMMRNYPSSIEEALSTPETIMAFNRDILDEMAESCRAPVYPEGIDSTVTNVFKPFMPGRTYVAGSDVALGVGGDYHVTVILDARSLETVADIMSNTITPEDFALKTVDLLKYYHSPVWWPEHNLYGKTVIRKAIDLGYRNIGKRGDKPVSFYNITDSDLKRLGFFTDEPSRGDLFGSLMGAVNNRQVTVYNRQGVEQLGHLYRNPRMGRIEATPGNHDDYPIALGIALLKAAPISTPRRVIPVTCYG